MACNRVHPLVWQDLTKLCRNWFPNFTCTFHINWLLDWQNTTICSRLLLKLECGPMPNVTVALPNISGALCSTPQSLADAHYYMPCSNTAKTQKPLKVAGVPQTPETISADSGPKFTILWAHVEEILLLNKFFFRLSIRALVAKI